MDNILNGPVNVDVYIYSDDSGVPDEQLWTGTIEYSATSSYEWKTLTPNIDVTANSVYWIILKAGHVDAVGTEWEMSWQYESGSDVYSGGGAQECLNRSEYSPPSSGWTAVDYDFKFKVTIGNVTFPTSTSNVEFINFDDKMYFIGDGYTDANNRDFLMYTDGDYFYQSPGKVPGK